MHPKPDPGKRVVLVYWKDYRTPAFEIFSNLKNFCLSYPDYNYNTLNNYLSKLKIPYDKQDVRVERMEVILKPKRTETSDWNREIFRVVRKVKMKNANDEKRDARYWMTKLPKERMAAITFLNSQFFHPAVKMDKTKVVKKYNR